MGTIAELPLTPFTYTQALQIMTRQQLRTALTHCDVRRRDRGWYERVGETLAAGERWELTRADHLFRLGVALAHHPGCAASHDSSALLHELPLVLSPEAEVHLVRIEDAPSSRRLPGVVIHHADSVATPTTTVDGMRCTEPPRAAADVLRSRRLPHGLAMVEQAIRTGRLSEAEVRAVLDQQHRWVGRPKARQALDLVDTRRESWGESYSAGVIALAELPQPIPQVEVYDESFAFVARVDGLLDHEGVVIESDGQVKYLIGATPDTSAEVASSRLEEEATRQARIERLGLSVARWMTDEAMHQPEVVGNRINAATTRALSTSFTGWVKWEGEFRKLPLLPRAA